MPPAIRKILIANRGEIAMRIIRTLKKSGIGAIGIFSEIDSNAPWIRLCDSTWSIGTGNLAETYLDIDKIIKAALETGADAIHPGYGFLSENYRFAEACIQNGLIFIGPSSQSLKIAGDKLTSNNMVKNLGIPVTEKITGNFRELLQMEDRIEFPVIAKAVAGGGGRGIRKVHTAAELENILRTVSSEAYNSFGDDRVYLEKFMDNPRHIEVQILGDIHGNRVHLFDRECSVQRRHQKLIEEAPAVNLTSRLRKSITDAALKIADQLALFSAGTIEFLVDQEENFVFLEINPRIQVEHGVTEMITGIDIINEQINIANGNLLSFTQDQINCSGHASEARIYAEDPENDMVPLPGTIHYLSFPHNTYIRTDTGAEIGSEILPEFDPLIAKVLTYGTNRAESIERLRKTLTDTKISGLFHNLPLLEIIIGQPDFSVGKISTTWLENVYTTLAEQILKVRQNTNSLIPVITAGIAIINQKIRGEDPWRGYWRNVNQLRLRNGKQLIEMEYERQSNYITFYIDNDIFRVSNVYTDDYGIEYMINDEFNKWYVMSEKEGYIGVSDGHFMYFICKYAPGDVEFKLSGENEDPDDNTVMAPQPGTIVDIKVCEGQSVNRGDYLLTLESMKLENTIMAATGGVIKKILIKAGDKVRKNEPLMNLQQIVTN